MPAQKTKARIKYYAPMFTIFLIFVPTNVPYFVILKIGYLVIGYYLVGFFFAEHAL